jgi:hypothetical protein
MKLHTKLITKLLRRLGAKSEKLKTLHRSEAAKRGWELRRSKPPAPPPADNGNPPTS